MGNGSRQYKSRKQRDPYSTKAIYCIVGRIKLPGQQPFYRLSSHKISTEHEKYNNSLVPEFC